jgi:NarL family two-component system response regulator YdfI
MVDVWIMTPSGIRRDWLARCVAADSSLHIVGTATTFPFLRSLMAETTGDIVLVDVRPESQPSIVRDWLLQLSELAALLVLAPERDPEIYNRLVQTGAGGILQTDPSDEQIVQAIKSIAAGLMVFDYAALPQRPEDDPSAEVLTPRENEVLRLLADGLGNKEIASRLNISEHTIKFHIRSILGKLGASSRTEAVSRGLRSGLIEL